MNVLCTRAGRHRAPWGVRPGRVQNGQRRTTHSCERRIAPNEASFCQGPVLRRFEARRVEVLSIAG